MCFGCTLCCRILQQLQNLHLADWIPGKEAHLGKEKPLETQGALRQLLRFFSREVTPKQLYTPPTNPHFSSKSNASTFL